MKYGQLSCIEFYSCYHLQCPSIDLFTYWTPGCDQRDPMNQGLSILSLESFPGIGSIDLLKLSMYLSKEVKNYLKNSGKLKDSFIIFGWSWSKMSVAFY